MVEAWPISDAFGHSTSHADIHLVDFVNNSIERGETPLTLFFDLKKLILQFILLFFAKTGMYRYKWIMLKMV